MLKFYYKYPRKCHKIEHLYLFDFRTLIRVREMTTSIYVLNSNTFFLRVYISHCTRSIVLTWTTFPLNPIN